jgi:anti-sigma-K factor RskA
VNLDELIASGLLESYVLGTASEEERIEVTRLCAKHPEVLAEVEKIESALINYAELQSPPPDSKMRERVLTNLDLLNQYGNTKQPPPPKASATNGSGKPVKVIPLYDRRVSRRLVSMRWMTAASLTLLIGSGLGNLYLFNKLSTARAELKTANDEKTFFAQKKDTLQTNLASLQSQAEHMKQFMMLSHDPNTHRVELKSVEGQTNAKAMVYMNVKTNEVVIDPMNLPSNATDKQYQLWALLPGNKVVDAGVFDAGDSAMMQKLKHFPSEVQGFAVTLEKRGGVQTAEGPMVVMGNISL